MSTEIGHVRYCLRVRVKYIPEHYKMQEYIMIWSNKNSNPVSSMKEWFDHVNYLAEE